MLADNTSRSKVSKRYQKVKGIQKVPKGPKYPKVDLLKVNYFAQTEFLTENYVHRKELNAIKISKFSQKHKNVAVFPVLSLKVKKTTLCR